MHPLEPIAAQIDDIYRHRVLRARERDPMEKMWDGPRLFEGVLHRMRAGIRAHLGTEDRAATERELRRRLAILAATHSRHDG